MLLPNIQICCFVKIWHFIILIILSCGHLKNSTCRKRLPLNFLFLPKDQSSKRSSIVIHCLPGNCIQGKINSCHRRGWAWTLHPEKLCHRLSCLPWPTQAVRSSDKDSLVRGQNTFLYIFYFRDVLQNICIFPCDQLWSRLLWLFNF